jgi:hypothetical protein
MNAPPDYKFPPMFGEREVFVISLDGALKAYAVEGAVRGVAW